MGQEGHLDSKKRKEHSKQRRGGIQIEQRFWSTFPHHALNGSFQQLQKDDVEWKGWQSEEAVSLAVKRN